MYIVLTHPEPSWPEVLPPVHFSPWNGFTWSIFSSTGGCLHVCLPAGSFASLSCLLFKDHVLNRLGAWNMHSVESSLMLYYWPTLDSFMYCSFFQCAVIIFNTGHSWLVPLFCSSQYYQSFLSQQASMSLIAVKLSCQQLASLALCFHWSHCLLSSLALFALFLTAVWIVSGEKRWSTFIFKCLFLRFFMKLKVWKALREHNGSLHWEWKALWVLDSRWREEGKWDKGRSRKKCALLWKGVRNLCWCKQDG